MTEPPTWRSLRSVMLLTLHVAAVSALIHFVNGYQETGVSLVFWVVTAIGVATFVSWPLSQAIFASRDLSQSEIDRTCPLCQRVELRPMVRPGEGIFQPVSNYRCAGCRTTVRWVGDSKIIEAPLLEDGSPNPLGIRFLDESSSLEEVRFLDDPP